MQRTLIQQQDAIVQAMAARVEVICKTSKNIIPIVEEYIDDEQWQALNDAASTIAALRLQPHTHQLNYKLINALRPFEAWAKERMKSFSRPGSDTKVSTHVYGYNEIFITMQDLINVIEILKPFGRHNELDGITDSIK